MRRGMTASFRSANSSCTNWRTCQRRGAAALQNLPGGSLSILRWNRNRIPRQERDSRSRGRKDYHMIWLGPRRSFSGDLIKCHDVALPAVIDLRGAGQPPFEPSPSSGGSIELNGHPPQGHLAMSGPEFQPSVLTNRGTVVQTSSNRTDQNLQSAERHARGISVPAEKSNTASVRHPWVFPTSCRPKLQVRQDLRRSGPGPVGISIPDSVYSA